MVMPVALELGYVLELRDVDWPGMEHQAFANDWRKYRQRLQARRGPTGGRA
jgi:hypothetical protein